MDKQRAKIIQRERRLQQACVKWFDFQYPKLRFLLFHIPNGGKRNKIEAYQFKLMGVRAGVADLFLSVGTIPFHGLYIEIKQEGEYQSDNQKEFQARVTECGYEYVIVHSVDAFINCVYSYLLVSKFHKPLWRQQSLKIALPGI